MALCLWSQSHFFLTSQTPALASNVSISHGLLWPWLLTWGGREGRTTADRPCSVCSSWEGLSPGSPSMTCQASVPLFPSGLVAPPLVTYQGLRVCLGREEQHTLQPPPPPQQPRAEDSMHVDPLIRVSSSSEREENSHRAPSPHQALLKRLYMHLQFPAPACVVGIMSPVYT